MKFKVGDKVITREGKVYVIEKINKEYENGIIIRENDHIAWSICYPRDLKLATPKEINKLYDLKIKELEIERKKLLEKLKWI